MKRNPSPQPRVPWRASPLPARHQLARTSLPQHLTAPTPFPCRSHPARRSAKNRSSRSRYQRGLGAMMLVGDNDVRQRQRRSIRVSREERAGVLFHDCMNVWQFTDLGGREEPGREYPSLAPTAPAIDRLLAPVPIPVPAPISDFPGFQPLVTNIG